MLSYIAKRIFYLVMMLLIISLIAYSLVWLTPGSFLSRLRLNLPQREIERLSEKYGLADSLWGGYWKWIEGIITRGDFGLSFNSGLSVVQELFFEGRPGGRLPLRLASSLLLVFSTMLFSWLVGLSIGIFSATHRYSLGDRALTFLSYLGLGFPSFILALLFYISFPNLLSFRNEMAPWAWARIPLIFIYILIIGIASITSLSRHMRSSLLDILGEEYIQAARAKGLSEHKVTYKHALKNAINPLISMLGLYIPTVFEGTIVVAYIFQLPIIERSYWQAFREQDLYVIMTGLLFFGTILLLGNLMADLLLLWTNPRIRYES